MQNTLRNVVTTGRWAIGLVALVLVIGAFARVITRPFMRDSGDDDRTRLTVLHWGDKNEDAIVSGLVDAFEKENPDVRVVRMNAGQSSALTTKLQTMAAAGEPPDVFYMGYEHVANFVSEGIPADIDALIEADRAAGNEATDLSDFFPAVLNCFRYDGERIGEGTLYGLPKDFTTVGFYYNKDLFRQAGVQEPSPDGWTWDEFIAAARAIGQLENCYGADFVTWEAMIRVYLWTYGLDFATPGFEQFLLQDSQVQATLGQLQSWFHDEGRTLASAKTQLETGQEPFLTGRVGLAGPLGRWKVPTFRLIEDFDWEFAPLPHQPGKPLSNGVFTTAWAIAEDSPNRDAAWRFLKFMCGERGQELNCENGLAIPALRSVAAGPAFTDPDLKPRNDRVYLDAADVARPIAWPADPKYLHQLKIALEGIFKQAADISIEMAAVEAKWTANRREGGPRPRMPWGIIAAVILVPLILVKAVGIARWYRRRPPRMAFREELAGIGMIAPWLIGFAAFTAFPIILSLLLMFTDWSGLRTLGHAEFVGLDNLRRIMSDPTFRMSLWVTAFYVLLAVPSSQIVALGAALLMNQEVRGIGIYRAVWYLPSVLAGVGLAVMWKWVFHHEHGMLVSIFDPLLASLGTSSPRWFEKDAGTWAVPAFAIINIWAVGGTMMIYLAGLKGIPKDLYEAAAIDGAGGWTRFRNVTLPMLSPVIFFNGIIAIIASFQVFTQAYVMTGGGPGNSTRFYVVYLYNVAFDFHEMGYASAMAWMLLVIVLVLTLLVMRGSRRFVYYEALK